MAVRFSFGLVSEDNLRILKLSHSRQSCVLRRPSDVWSQRFISMQPPTVGQFALRLIYTCSRQALAAFQSSSHHHPSGLPSISTLCSGTKSGDRSSPELTCRRCNMPTSHPVTRFIRDFLARIVGSSFAR